MSEQTISARVAAPGGTAFAVILSLSFCHFLNDLMQSLVPAIYPVLKESYSLDFGQVGLITLAFQCTASLLQPLVGMVTDRRPMPYSLAVGMGFTLIGLVLMAHAASYPLILLAAALVGMGSSVFHPEASRVARMASGGRYGLAQSLFQVGGNTGSAAGPLLAAFIVVPQGQRSLVWFSAAALIGMVVLFQVGGWYACNRAAGRPAAKTRAGTTAAAPLSRRKVALAITVLVALLFSKNVYTASLSSYFTFYLIDRFDVSVQVAQFFLFAFLAALVVGTLIGGALADRIGRVPVMWFSILGALPFTLALPHVGLAMTGVLSVVIGVIMASAFSAILVYAQELMPGRVGLVAGMFFGFSFGLGGLGAAALGQLADLTSIGTVYQICAFLPALGLLTAFLPKQRA
ncbi:fosmidomycin resistance protein [Siccirubricoccus deserti]|uniref:MFS transporter n=1 Tax=Siccirubricoccus deserti TaxID=2013562 RepID=A0A9X0QU18_9PROT|nr:MFS transporter [Siccirubricoccus deserti]MBC4013696.1 MFS transporter [Siccirubricoccus deserti]GGC28737.1 fosmidomycin resistance protein [Siccirubricoccus deserti]